MLDLQYIEKNLYGIFEMQIQLNKKSRINTHIIIIKEESVYTALSIEFGEAGEGSSPEKALQNLELDIFSKIKFYAKENKLKNIFEDEFTNLWIIYMQYSKILKILHIAKSKNKKLSLKELLKNQDKNFLISENLINTLIEKSFENGTIYGYLIGVSNAKRYKRI